MRKSLLVAAAAVVIVAPLLVLAFAPAPDADSKAVEYKGWNDYAEKHESGLKGSDSLLVFTQRSDFDRVFALVFTPRGLPDPIPRDAFDNNLFVAVVKRDTVFWDYKVEKVTAKGDTLTVAYRATERKGLGPAAGATGKAYGTQPRRDTIKVRDGRTEKRGATTERVGTTARIRTTEKTISTTEKVGPRTTARARFTTRKTFVTGGRDGDLVAVVDSSLILSVPKGKYAAVVFVENGRKAGTVRVGN